MLTFFKHFFDAVIYSNSIKNLLQTYKNYEQNLPTSSGFLYAIYFNWMRREFIVALLTIFCRTLSNHTDHSTHRQVDLNHWFHLVQTKPSRAEPIQPTIHPSTHLLLKSKVSLFTHVIRGCKRPNPLGFFEVDGLNVLHHPLDKCL